MKRLSALRTLLVFSVIMVFGLACSGGSSTTEPTERPTKTAREVLEPTATEEEIPTEEPVEIETEEPTKRPTREEVADEPPAYFIEDDWADLSNWTYFLMSGEENDLSVTTGGGVLKFELTGEDIWVYLLYKPYLYKDVRIDAVVENRGKNNNNVSLICRYSDEGWYEFNIANNGLYDIFAYVSGEGYNRVASGGSTHIKTGKDVNEYTAICDGTKLELYINGVKTKSIEEKQYRLRNGQIGISVSSFDTLPIIVEWDAIRVIEP